MVRCGKRRFDDQWHIIGKMKLRTLRIDCTGCNLPARTFSGVFASQMPGKRWEARRPAAAAAAAAAAMLIKFAQQVHRWQMVLENDTCRSRWLKWSSKHRQLVDASTIVAVSGGAHGAHARHDVGAMALINTGCSDMSCCFSRGDMAGLRTLVVEVSSSLWTGCTAQQRVATCRMPVQGLAAPSHMHACCNCEHTILHQRQCLSASYHLVILTISSRSKSWHSMRAGARLAQQP